MLMIFQNLCFKFLLFKNQIKYIFLWYPRVEAFNEVT